MMKMTTMDLMKIQLNLRFENGQRAIVLMMMKLPPWPGDMSSGLPGRVYIARHSIAATF